MIVNLYEVMYIVKPDLEGEELEGAIARVGETLEKEGGRIELLKKIGKRKLAYEINDYREGYYVLLHVQAEAAVVPALEHFFKVSEGYLRYMVVRLDAEQKKEAALKEEALKEKKEAPGAVAEAAEAAATEE